MCDGYILSYRNPDTDSLCSSLAYSIYMAKKGKDFKVIALGEILPETQFILMKANINKLNLNCDYDDSKDIILIDTHHLAQLPHLKYIGKVIKIFDHHPNGDDTQFYNAYIDNRLIGAAATIIAENVLNDKLMDAQLAMLLGASIISNTMNFEAPSTSELDKAVFAKLQHYYKFSNQFISEMFYSKNDILARTEEEVINSDVKLFDIADKKIKIAQIELVNIEKNLDLHEFIRRCFNLSPNHDIDYYFLSLIDILQKKTYVITFDEKSMLLRNSILESTINDNLLVVNRILLRKTDFVEQIKKKLKA